MFEWIRRPLRQCGERGRAKKEAAQEKVIADRYEPEFLGPREGKEAVVFVHGLGGHFRDTWKQFPNLLHDDPDLPRLQILLAGYDASPLPWTNSIEDEAQRFISNMRSLFVRDEEIFLVGHSMGGLVILQGLIQEMIGTRAERAPTKDIRHVTLYASPVMGAQIAGILRAASKLPIAGKAVSQQLIDLAQGDFCNRLISEVTNRIYSPTIASSEAASKRRIKILACVGLRDLFVTKTSAEGIFVNPPPSYLNDDHFSIKEPKSRTDLRYLPLKNILEAHFVDWLDSWRVRLQDAQQGRDAQGELWRRLRHALEARLAARVDLNWPAMDSRTREERMREYFSLVIDPSASRPGMRLSDVLNLVSLEI
jgi:pimeloyl-ACP methyl ester carboxylesterase